MAQVDSATEAFRRLLDRAEDGEQAKVDVLVTLIQRTVFVPTWTDGGSDYRTLVNSDGEAALPIFTGRDVLKEASFRFGWNQPTASHGTFHREVGSREALRFVVSNQLSYAVLDVSTDYSLEVSLAEIAPLLTKVARRESSGPYHASGRVSDSMLEAVRSSQRPQKSYSEVPHPPAEISSAGRYGAAAKLDDAIPASKGWVSSLPPRPISEPPDPDGKRLIGSDPPPALDQNEESSGSLEEMALNSLSSSPASSTEASTSEEPKAPSAPPPFAFDPDQPIVFGSITFEPGEDLLAALRDVLRDYPEVEWASLCKGSQGEEERNAIALRLIQDFRNNLPEIESGLRLAAERMGVPVTVIVLSSSTLVRESRAHAIPFFPWRSRKPSIQSS